MTVNLRCQSDGSRQSPCWMTRRLSHYCSILVIIGHHLLKLRDFIPPFPETCISLSSFNDAPAMSRHLQAPTTAAAVTWTRLIERSSGNDASTSNRQLNPSTCAVIIDVDDTARWYRELDDIGHRCMGGPALGCYGLRNDLRPDLTRMSGWSALVYNEFQYITIQQPSYALRVIPVSVVSLAVIVCSPLTRWFVNRNKRSPSLLSAKNGG